MTRNPRTAIIELITAGTLLTLMVLYALSLGTTEPLANFADKVIAPCAHYWFGTDNLGRSLWVRCFQGLLSSLTIGVTAAVVSSTIALTAGALAAVNPACDRLVRGIVDMMLALPHILLLILVCFTLGGGTQGVIGAVALTHWPRLALILRSETRRINQADFVMQARRTGMPALTLIRRHYLPLLVPQWLIGGLLIFPHAVLHSAALSFLGFGQAPHEASLGLLLADALRFIGTGAWWMAVFPGLMLLILVLTFDRIGKAVQKLWFKEDAC